MKNKQIFYIWSFCIDWVIGLLVVLGYLIMISFTDLKNFFRTQDCRLIIAADGEPVVSTVSEEGVFSTIPAGGVSVALDPIVRAAFGTYIARAKHITERLALDKNDKMLVGDSAGNYQLRRLFFADEEIDNYYNGFSNQTLWPLCHVAFEKPVMNDAWYGYYKKVNEIFARAIRDEMKQSTKREKTLVWVHDYQLALVPGMLRDVRKFGDFRDSTLLAMFWHIPWPTWEVFRILPQKKEILESLLSCDLLAFHRGYQARNFLETVDQELPVRIDREKQQVYYKDHVTTVKSHPLGIDTDGVRMIVPKEVKDSSLARTIREVLGFKEEKPHPFDWYFEKYKVVFGVDRLDYTKGIVQRLRALDRFFEKNPKYRGKIAYLGISAPSRESIGSYKRLKKEVKEVTVQINAKYQTSDWRPIHLIHGLFQRDEVYNFYRRAHLCLVTPLDDGMNLVSKEFVIAASQSSDPGMLVLSQFAGSATDLGSSLIVNPYDVEEVADAIKRGLEMKREERVRRIKQMTEALDENNVYSWAQNFLREAVQAAR